jgi:hypothetical protein
MNEDSRPPSPMMTCLLVVALVAAALAVIPSLVR